MKMFGKSEKSKVLYITKDVHSYKQGNYYADWLEIFQKNNRVTILDNFKDDIDLSKYDLIVFGHSFIDLVISNLTLFNKRYFNKIEFMVLRELEYFLNKNKVLNNIKNSDIKKVYFSKNDYKRFNVKTLLSNFLNIDLFISHTKSSLNIFKDYEINSELLWMPFSISKEKYFKSKEKKYDIGMRANNNKIYNNGERELLFKQVRYFSKDRYNVDLHLSQNGECFLHGQKYIDWISECQLLVNSVSAYGTVGPKFLEGIACGTISIAVEDEYEGLLVADKHYLSIKKDFSNLEEKVSKFFNDNSFKEELLRNAKLLLDEHSIENQHKKLIQDILK
jgi:hypothetical protein